MRLILNKFSIRFEEDYLFYLANKDKFKFCGTDVQEFPFDENGIDAKEAFYIFDSTGNRKPTNQPDLVKQLIICKKAVNWQIKQWVLGWHDMLEPLSTYIKEFICPPDWVTKSINNQLLKRKLI